MIGKSEAVREAQPGELQPIKELLRPRDPAEGRDRAFDARDFHFPVQAPDLGSPAPCSDLRLKLRLITWYRNYIRAPRGTQCFAQIARREQMVLQVAPAQEQDVDIAVELAMLKTVVEQMDAGALTRRRAHLLAGSFALGQQAGLVTLGSHINRDAGSARNLQRLVAKVFCCAAGIDAERKRGVPPVSARKHIHMQAAPRERIGQ